MMVLKAGAVFAKHYEVVRAISAGGMGVVYEVLHRETKRRRALKIMLPHVVTDALLRERFAQEAIVTAEIESEHLCEIFDAGIDDETDCPFIVMELLRGEDLAATVRRGQLTPNEVLVFMDQIALALEKTHAAGIVHRDLKPENLYVTKRDDGSVRLKILDFGIAKVIRATSEEAKSTTKPFGTPYYMAREQVTGEANLIGPASDLYALAHIAYTLLVGVPYFDDEATEAGGNVLTLLLAVGHGAKEAATTRARRRGIELPPRFDAWFAKATRVDPRERFQSARTMIEELRAAVTGVVSAVTMSEAAALRGRATDTRGIAESERPSGNLAQSDPVLPVRFASAGTVPIESHWTPPHVSPLTSRAGTTPPELGTPPHLPLQLTPPDPNQTGAPQSISTHGANLPSGSPSSRFAIWGVIAAGLLGSGAGAFWWTQRASNEPVETVTPATSANPEIANSGPLVTAAPLPSASTGAIAASASSSAAPSASGSVSPAPSVSAAPKSNRPARPTETTRPVWETR